MRGGRVRTCTGGVILTADKDGHRAVSQSLDGFNIFSPVVEGGNTAVRAEVWYWKSVHDASQPNVLGHLPGTRSPCPDGGRNEGPV